MAFTVNLHVSEFEARSRGSFVTVVMSDPHDPGSEAFVFLETTTDCDNLTRAIADAKDMLAQ